MKWNEMKWNEMKSNQIKSNQIKPNQIKSNQEQLHKIYWGSVRNDFLIVLCAEQGDMRGFLPVRGDSSGFWPRLAVSLDVSIWIWFCFWFLIPNIWKK